MNFDMVRFSVSLPDWYHSKLEAWALFKGTNRATLAGNIVQARIEANWEGIEEEIRQLMHKHDLSTEELIQAWLKSAKENPRHFDEG